MILLRSLVLFFLFFSCAFAETLSQKEIERIEDYLNNIKTLKAHFIQLSPNGTTSEGMIYLLRPGFLKLEYDPPSPIQVIANGKFLIYFDKQLQQTSYIPLNETPAGILVKPNLRLNDETLKIIDSSKQSGILTVTVTQKKESKMGEITLIFTQSPFALRQWKVTDVQGNVTDISLLDMQTDVSLPKSLFDFKDPNFGKNKE